jgi:hypothetical protein
MFLSFGQFGLRRYRRWRHAIWPQDPAAFSKISVFSNAWQTRRASRATMLAKVRDSTLEDIQDQVQSNCLPHPISLSDGT